MQFAINNNIPGLTKKRVAFTVKPANSKWWAPFSSLERNGMLNVGLSRNWARLMYPMVPMFMFFYTMQPVIHGHVYITQYNNFNTDALYFKFSRNRPMFTDQTITRIA